MIISPLESNGAIPINIQDQHTNAFDLFFSQDVGAATTLTTDAVEDAFSISVTNEGDTRINNILVELNIDVRFLEKINGEWKIVYLSTVNTTSYDEEVEESEEEPETKE